MGQWFTTIEEPDKITVDNLPLAFIHEDLYYTKEIDGMYHVWSSPSAKMNGHGHECLKIYNPNVVFLMLEKAKYRQDIPYFTNYVNKKL